MKPDVKRMFGIQQKLFLVVLGALVANILLLLLLGSTAFEWLYTQSKLTDLRHSADEISGVYQQGGEAYNTALENAENRNIVVRVFGMGQDSEPDVAYFTRRGFFAPLTEAGKPANGKQKDDHSGDELIRSFFESGLDEELQVGTYLTEEKNFGRGPGNQNLVLYAKLGENLYLSLDTPRQFIAESADLAIKSCATISLFTLLLAAAALYVLCRRLTAPIKGIQQTAESIAALDFSARCAVTTQDELGQLARAVNEMSDSLRGNIRELEDANRKLRDDLHRQEQQDQMRKRFIANVSHDFKTPLTLITSYADSLCELGEDQRELREEYCGIISAEGYQMSRMVKQLLNLSRLESGMVQISPMPFAISEVIDEVLRRHRLPAQQRGLTVQREGEDDPIVNADFQRIGQVFTNLYENAVKYANQNGTVRVCSKREGKTCLVTVFNTGEAIPQKHLEQLFISFYRIDEARSGEGQSYGLGLAIVRGILELHGQEYGARNVPGGVEFWFRLSLAEIDSAEE